MTIVVGTTVDSIANDPTKDVLLEVYAPWCSACQAFAKTYAKLAAAMETVPSVVIAKMDGTRNEHADLDIEEYPTVLFYPAEDGAKPIKIPVGGLKELVAAIHSKATVPFDIPDFDLFEIVDFDSDFDEEDDEYLDLEDAARESEAAGTAGEATGAEGVENAPGPPAAAALHVEL